MSSNLPGPSNPSGRPARRARRPSLSAEQFLERVFDLFVEHGYEGTSVDTIAAEVGIAKRTFYQRYGDKESLFRMAMHHAIRKWIVPVDRLRAAESGDLDRSLLDIGGILVTNILSADGMKLMRLTNAVSGRMPEIGAYNVKTGTEPTIEYIADLFQRHLGIAAAAAEDAAEMFLYLVVGGPANAAAWGVALDPEDVKRRTALSVRTFLHGMLDGIDTADASEGAGLRAALADILVSLKDNQTRIEQALRAD